MAENRPTNQSSTREGRISSRAVDGSYFNAVSFSQTAIGETPSWWKVDLEEMCLIERIDIFNKYERTCKYNFSFKNELHLKF